MEFYIYDTATVVFILGYCGMAVLGSLIARERHIVFVKTFSVIGWVLLMAHVLLGNIQQWLSLR